MYLVVFRNRKRAQISEESYAADADRMETLARAQPGFLSFKSYVAGDGEVIALSEWASEDAAREWRRNADHAAVQRRGRAAYYEDYTLLAGTPSRVHRFSRAATGADESKGERS